MLMNVFLFFPLGLTLSNALPRKWHRWGRIAFTTLIGCILGAGDRVRAVPLRAGACRRRTT